MDPFEVNMNKALRKLAEDIIPNDKRFKKAKICADKIVKLLQSKSKFDIGRVCMAGSTGKKTTIIDSDIDCVIFVNEEYPPFKDVLEDFENILTMANSYNIRDVRSTKYSIQFKAMDFDFDILPAANFTVDLELGGDKLIDIQQERVLAHIKRDPKKYGYMYSSSLADAATRFMKRQNGFVNEMVRIVKFWYKTLYFSEYVSGAKNCIELVAVCAANQEDRMGTRSYLRTFDRFIKYLQDFDNLNIHFEKHQILDRHRPRVIDPVNPYNNFAKNWDPKSIQLVKTYANESIRRLEFLTNSRMVRLDQLFEPQPVYIREMREVFKYDPKRTQWLVSTTETFSLLPELKISNERLHTDYKLWNCLEICKKYFQFAICASKASECDENQIQEVVTNTIDRQIRNTKRTWCSTDEKHEEYDVTFTIPFSDQKAVRISYRL